jgi:hypothetical protein
VCHERAFLDHFFGKTGRRTSIASQIGFIAGSISVPDRDLVVSSNPRREP